MTLPPITDEDRQFLHYNPNTDDVVQWVLAYAQAAVLKEREACAKLCELQDEVNPRCRYDYVRGALDCAAAIRSRGE